MSDHWTIYHHPRCAKSRAALELLSEHGVEPNVILYQKTGLTTSQLRDLARRLGVRPKEFLRRSELAHLGLALNLDDDAQVLEAIAAHPALLERPIVVRGERAVVARPHERALELLDDITSRD